VEKDDDKKAAQGSPAAKAEAAKAEEPRRDVDKAGNPLPEPKPYTPVAKDPAPASAPTLIEGKVDEFNDRRNSAGQLAPEDGTAGDPLAEELKEKFSGEGGGTF
jgi:hypothetical protein